MIHDFRVSLVCNKHLVAHALDIFWQTFYDRRTLKLLR